MIIYLASPYNDPDPKVKHARWENAVQAAIHLVEDEHAIVFSPIAHGHWIHAWGGESVAGHWEQWQEIDRAMIAACDRFVVLQLAGWKQSRGIQAEVTLAAARGLAIEFAAWNADADRFAIKHEEQGTMV